MDTHLIMSLPEVKKCDIINKTIGKELNGSEAAELLNITSRHVRRLKEKVTKNGIEALIHGNRGKPGNRRMQDDKREKIVTLLKQKYSDFGPTLATEKLIELDSIECSCGAVRSIMIAEEIWKPKSKKKEVHREWRQRRSCKGELVQYDGSYEHWFGSECGEICLLASIDDADSEVWAQFDEHEGIEPTFNFWRNYIERNGKPNSIYVDKFSTYSMNHKIAKDNPDTLTQFERAMKELNTDIIHAHSPQAKGRIERLFRTLQDRLIKDLRLAGITNSKEANVFLEKVFLPKFNAKFMVEPRSEANLHKKLSEPEKKKLDSTFSRQYEKVVMNDFTISHKKICYQLEKIQPVTICKQDKVTVEERMDKAIHFRLRGKYLNYKVLPEKPKKIGGKKNLQWVIPGSTAHVPPANHPWRQANNMVYLKKLTKVTQ